MGTDDGVVGGATPDNKTDDGVVAEDISPGGKEDGGDIAPENNMVVKGAAQES